MGLLSAAGSSGTTSFRDYARFVKLRGARGVDEMFSALRQRIVLRWILLTILAVGFTLTIIRFHTRTVLLGSLDSRSKERADRRLVSTQRLNREERRVAAVVREFPDKEEAADRLALEEMRGRSNDSVESSEYIFVWGYRPEIYYWSGLQPASRYLSTQPLTGVPADVHFFEGQTSYRSLTMRLNQRLASNSFAIWSGPARHTSSTNSAHLTGISRSRSSTR